MSERSDLLDSIASTSADYRAGEIAAPTPDHVDRWVQQFDAAVQVPILREMDHVLKRTYISRKETDHFLGRLVTSSKLVGDDPCAFWSGVQLLDIQGGGASQKDMLKLLKKHIEGQCALEGGEDDSAKEVFVYLDDAVFTGNRVRQDLVNWVNNSAPSNASVHIVCLALHSGATYYAGRMIREAASKVGKNIELQWWRCVSLEDRKNYTDSSDVLRPVAIPPDAAVQEYVKSMRYQPILRNAGQVGAHGTFSSDTGRQLLEQEFLKAGVRIRAMCPNLGDTQRPLGHMTLETLGFGSLIVTFRNCPNNAPLALWVGEPWYPLFPRTTNSDTALKNLMSLFKRT